MRIVFLTQYYPPEIGAPQVRLSALARTLSQKGHEIEVVTAMPNHPTGRIFPEFIGRFYVREEVEGIPVHRVWVYAAVGAGLRRLINYGSFTVACLWALARCQRPDYLFVESPPIFLAVPAYVVNLFWRSKIIFNVADLWPDSVRELGLMKNKVILKVADWLEGWSYRVSHKVNAVTEGIRDTLIRSKGVAPNKITFLPNGVDTALFHPRQANEQLARELGLEGKQVFLYAGTLGYAQGLETVLQAAVRLRDQPNITFVFIGDGSEKAKLVQQTDQLNLMNVKFLPPAPLSYVAELYSLATAGMAVLRNVSLFQGARPSKIFPAMSSGVPVLYSGEGEGARLVNEAQAGLTVPPEDPAALAEAVLTLVNQPELASQLGKGGRRYVEENLSWPALIADWMEQLQQS